MSRNVSAELKAAIYAPETNEEFIVLLTLSHTDLSVPIRVNSSGAEIISRSNTFLAFPFSITLPDDVDGQPPRAKLTIDNIDRIIVQTIRTISSAPSVLVEIVRESAPDTVEASFPDFKMTGVSYNQNTVEGELTVEEFMGEPYPARVFSPADFPALF